MQQRPLGRTGHLSSIIIFGTAAFWEIDQESANQALDLALADGVNHIDVAPQYGQAEERLGPWLESHRDQFFVGCKTLERGRGASWADLQRSLQRLRTPAVDLYQLHAVGTFEDLEAALKPGGAIETLQEAREKGLTRWLGITGHGLQAPAVHTAALERFDFDTVMFPIHPRLYANTEYRRDTERLLALCAEKQVGVQIIKAATKGPWGSQGQAYNTWYQPYDTAERIAQGVRFALSQPGVTGIPSAGDVRLLPMVLEAGKHFIPLTDGEQAALIDESRAIDPLFT
ncbi:MAG: aldo/keto reductase [Anaerolineae bacterium]|nr:aldo/keto reductase [Anaerolineae bacterium]